jgi:HAD superfamily hydrolase (TIGR01484 family)
MHRHIANRTICLITTVMFAMCCFFDSAAAYAAIYYLRPSSTHRTDTREEIYISLKSSPSGEKPVEPAKDNTTAIRMHIEGLKSANPNIRRYSIQSLIEIGAPAIPHLLDILQNDGYVNEYIDREYAAEDIIEVLASIGPDALPTLLEISGYQDSHIRYNAAKVFGNVKYSQEAIINALINLLHDKDSGVQAQAVGSLGEIGPPAKQSIPYIINILKKNKNTKVRAYALSAIGKIGHINQEGISVIADMLKEEDAEIRMRATEALGNIGFIDEGIIAYLAGMLDDTDYYVRWEAVSALGKIGPVSDKAVRAIIKALHDGSSDIRARAISSIGNADPKYKQAIPALLVNAMHDTDSYICLQAFYKLEQIIPLGEARLRDIMKILKDGDDISRLKAAGELSSVAGIIISDIGGMFSEYEDAYKAHKLAIQALRKYSDDNSTVQFLIGDDDYLRRHAITNIGREDSAKYDIIVPILIELLNYPGSDIHTRALEKLGKIGPVTDGVLPALIKLLEDSDGHIRKQAVGILGKMWHHSPDNIADALINVLNDKNSDVRLNSIRALANISPARVQVVAALEELLKDADSDIIICAAETLAGIGSAASSAVPALIELSSHDNGYVRRHAMHALGKIGLDTDNVIQVLVSSLHDTDNKVRWHAAKALIAIGPAVVPELIKAAEHDANHARKYAIYILGEIGFVYRVLPVIIKAAGDTDARVRWQALYALSKAMFFSSEIISLAIKSLGDENSDIRKQAGDIIIRTGPYVMPYLIEAFADKDSYICWQAVSYICRFGPVAISPLTEALGNINSDIRKHAAHALSRIGTDAADAAPALIRLIDDPNSDVQANVVYALGKIGIAGEGVVDALIKVLGHRDSKLRWRAAYALGKIGPVRNQVVPALVRLTEDRYSKVRWHSVSALGKIGPVTDEVLPAITKAAEDKNLDVRRHAIKQLAKIGPDAAYAAPVLVRILENDSSIDIRANAAYALGRLGGKAEGALQALIKASLNDTSSVVREEASKAFKPNAKYSSSGNKEDSTYSRENIGKDIRYFTESDIIGRPIKMIVSDFDRTLSSDPYSVTDDIVGAVERFIEEGGIFAIATGGRIARIDEIFVARIKPRLRGNIILLGELSSFIGRYDSKGNLFVDYEASSNESFLLSDEFISKVIEEFSERLGLSAAREEEFNLEEHNVSIITYKKQRVPTIYYEHSPEAKEKISQMHSLIHEIVQEGFSDDKLYMFETPRCTDISFRSKADGLDWMLKEFNIRPENAVVIGDTAGPAGNDRPMLMYSEKTLNIYVGTEDISILPDNILYTKASAEIGALEVLNAINNHRLSLNTNAVQGFHKQFRHRQLILAVA